MGMIEIRKPGGGTASIDESALEKLGTGLDGEIALKGTPGYEEAVTIWNAMIDWRPGAVVRCMSASDVQKTVNFARENGLELGIRGGGHNIAGKALTDGGLLIDFSKMRKITVDVAAKTAEVQPGATLADFDRETQAHGLTTPTGINSTTGIAGLTLGGGFGWTSRRFGMTIDNLLSADVVLATGEMVKASEKDNPDLFWAIRGGGGNFGVVTKFVYRLHEMGPEVLAGLLVYPIADAAEVFDQFRPLVEKAPDELAVWAVLRKAPPLPFLPEEWHGKEVLVLAACYSGPVDAGEKAMAGVRKIGKPIAEAIGAQPFAAWQQAFDPLLTPGARNYWKTLDFKVLTPEVCQKAIDFANKLPDDECEIFFGGVGGKASRVADDATAYAGRSANFVMNVHTRWRDKSGDDKCISWAREFHRALSPFALDVAYVNFLTSEEGDRLPETYGPNYKRLQQIKAKYDPDNFFRVNQNIRPAA